MSRRTRVGVVLDLQESGGYSAYPWYALRQNYSLALQAQGALVFFLPYDLSAIEEYTLLFDGLLIAGGNFDIDPKIYNESICSDTVTLNDKRTRFEFELFDSFFKANKPILGICGGHQLINVALGGSLVQDIPTQINTVLKHEQQEEKHIATHQVTVVANTRLAAVCGQLKFNVNSTHHQALKTLGKDVMVSALADDGVIEAIEVISHPYCIGVQWHPEYLSSEYDEKIIHSFVEAAKLYTNKNK